jgi:hypothetical protein
MQTCGTNISKKHFYWLAGKMGYPTGLFNKIKCNQQNISMIMEEWARKFNVSHLFLRVGFTNNDAELVGTDRLLLDVYLRSVYRPAEGLPMRIPRKPLPPEYDRLLDGSW